VFDQGQERCFSSNPAGAALVHAGMLPGGGWPAGEPLVVELLVLLTGNLDGEAPHGERLEPHLALEALRRGLDAGRHPWCTPQLVQPLADEYERLVRQCLNSTDSVAIQAGRNLTQAAEAVAGLCGGLERRRIEPRRA
jgi:hypothetical protein